MLAIVLPEARAPFPAPLNDLCSGDRFDLQIIRRRPQVKTRHNRRNSLGFKQLARRLHETLA
jgi:hypothetical protein